MNPESYYSLAEILPCGVQESDLNGVITFSNRAHHMMLGYNPGELVGLHVWDLLEEQEREPFKSWFLSLGTEQPAPQPYRARNCTRNGRRVEVQVDWKYKRDSHGLPTGIISAIYERTPTSESLRRSVSMLRASLEASADGILVVDRKGRVAGWNERFVEMWRLPVQLLDARDDSRLVAHVVTQLKDEEEFVAKVRRLNKQVQEESFDILEFKDGRVFERYSCPQWVDGRVEGRIWRFRDMTERKLAEQKLRESEQRYQLLFNISPDAVFLHHGCINGIPGRFVDVNDAACERLGYTRQELLQMRPTDIDAPETASMLPEVVEKIQREKHARWEGIHISKTGNRIPVEITTIGFDLNGQPMVLSTARDITERKRAEEALRQSEERFRSIFQESPLGIATCDNQFRFTKVNAAFCGMLGYESEQELLGRTFIDVTHPQHRAEDTAQVCGLLTGKIAFYRTEKRYVRKDGALIWAAVTVSTIRDADGTFIHFLAIIEDVTERRKAEQLKATLEEQLRQAQRLEAFGQLAGGVAHELNNVLTVIQSHASLLEVPNQPQEKLRESIKAIVYSAEWAAKFTRQLSTFSRRQAIQPTNLDLNEICEGMSRMLRRLIGEHIELRTAYSPESPIVHADRGMIEQVILNLIINARDAMPRGGRITLSTEAVDLDATAMSAHPKARPGRFVRLSIQDTGCGIPAQNLSRIFEPFFTTKAKGKGTGMGLSIVLGIVEQHQGWIQVNSVPERGTALHIYLPRLSGKITAEAWDPVLDVSGGTETILLVEDEISVRVLAESILEQAGYKVLAAPDGESAVQLWQQHAGKIRLLLTDVVMTGKLNGRELAEMLKKNDPQLRTVYFSGYARETLGPDFSNSKLLFLQKPFTHLELLQTVRCCLDEEVNS